VFTNIRFYLRLVVYDFVYNFYTKPSTIFLAGVENNDLRIHYMGDIETYGSNKQYNPVNIEPNECVTIIYTSGSSGFPKGAMISESAYRAASTKSFFLSCMDLVNFCYEPLAWVSARATIVKTFYAGGRTGFSTGDVSRLMEDLALVRPHYFSATPTIWNTIYAEFKAALSAATAHLSPEAITAEENRLLQQFSKLIPTRCRSITIGGAMISPVVFNFVKRCFSRCLIYESYGVTECGSVASDTIIEDTLQFRLISVPEMSYTTDDEPFPRGELFIKTKRMFSGYINNPEETRAALTEDGFFRTGDIVELRDHPDGRLRVHVIDRKKNFFKLSQGQFISPEFLQSIYIQSPFVKQIYIHGDLLADSVAAVIVPNREFAQAFALEHSLENFDMSNPNPQFYDAVLQDLRLIADKESLRKHEIPSRLIIDFEPFTPENGLLTSNMKPCRHKLAAHYGDRLKQYNTIEQRLKTIIETTVGQSFSTGKEDDVFISTGGDSLTAVRLSRMIENDLGISVPLRALLQPNMTLQQLAAVIKDPSQISSMSPSIMPQLLNDAELDLGITVGKCKNTATSPSIIFVTGTTGFVGAFLLAELLSVHPIECKFVCLVRCESLMNPLDRIKQNMLFYQIWNEDFQTRIIPLQGDLAKSCFGLDNETYDALANQIDLIFHCGAAVNFVLPYSKLYESNVCGAREIIRLASRTSACIPVHYISTISVLPFGYNEEVSIDEVVPNDLTTGYAQSKWVAEKLMARANRLGLPVVIYRLGLIGASTETGACNRNDLYTLLIAAMMKINCYPETILNARLYELPVNFTAKSIVYSSSFQPDVYGKIYHVLNSYNEILFINIINGMCRCGGVQLESVSLEEWRIKLKTIDDRDSLFQSVGEFLHGNSFEKRCEISAEKFYQSISSLDLPLLNNVYLIKWLTFILNNIIHQ
jgi:fatty acid CoA ligase FadD9